MCNAIPFRIVSIFKTNYPDSNLVSSLGETRFKKIFVELKKHLIHTWFRDYIPSSLAFSQKIKSLLPFYVEGNVHVLSFVLGLFTDTIHVQRIALYAYCQFVLSRSESNKSIPSLVLSTIINLLVSQCNCANATDEIVERVPEYVTILKKLPTHIWKGNI